MYKGSMLSGRMQINIGAGLPPSQVSAFLEHNLGAVVPAIVGLDSVEGVHDVHHARMLGNPLPMSLLYSAPACRAPTSQGGPDRWSA